LYLTGNISRLRYKAKPVNVVWETVSAYYVREREREKGERKLGGVVVRDTTIEGGSETIIFYLKVPRQCPLVLLIRVRLEFRVN
jgi:hypothetical protein